jgi:hypothetical protein
MSTAGAEPTIAGLTWERFTTKFGRQSSTLVWSTTSLATTDLPADPDELRTFALAC